MNKFLYKFFCLFFLLNEKIFYFCKTKNMKKKKAKQSIIPESLIKKKKNFNDRKKNKNLYIHSFINNYCL